MIYELIKTSEKDLQEVHEMICILEDQKLDFEAFRSVYLANLVDNDWCLFFICLDEVHQGFCSLHFKNSLHHAAEIAELEELIILPHFRGRGVGKEVIPLLQQVCKKRKVHQLEVCTNRKREAAAAFYTTCGFLNSHHKMVITF